MTDEPREPRSSGAVGWGILATGGIARLFARDLVAHGHRIAAVGSRSEDRARDFAQEFDIPAAYGSYEELVADAAVDVVYVATPHTLHAANAIAALDRGRHVLVEKPFTLNAAEARQVAEHAAARGLLVMEAMWTRFLPHMRFVREVIADGRIGEVRSVHADHTQLLTSDPTHRLNDPALGGGALLDLGAYPLAFVHDLLGPPEEVHAQAVLRDTGVDASVAAVLRHPGGALSTAYTSMETRGANRAVVLGTDGRIEIDRVWYTPSSVSVYDARDQLIDRFEQPVSGRGMQYQAAEVERCLAAGMTVSPLLPPEESVAIMVTMDRIRELVGVRYPQDQAAAQA